MKWLSLNDVDAGDVTMPAEERVEQALYRLYTEGAELFNEVHLSGRDFVHFLRRVGHNLVSPIQTPAGRAVVYSTALADVTIVPDRTLREGRLEFYVVDKDPEWYLAEAERWMNRYQEEKARVGH